MLNPTRRPLTIILFTFTILAFGRTDQVSAQPPPSNVKTDEDVLFFPTYGRFDQGGRVWRFDVHGKVFEPENSSTKRAALIAALRAATNVSLDADDTGGTGVLDDRIRPFLVDNERGKSVTIRMAGEQRVAGTSEANGHFSKSLTVGAESLAGAEARNGILEIEAVLRDSDSRSFTGRVHLIAPRGVSVISDIDDTIKHSQVIDKSELVKNTFLREFRAVNGMPELYTSLEKSGVAFHYVSGSPWQLYQALDAFRSGAGFPQGSFHLKHFRLKDSSVLELLSSQQKTKLAAIGPLLSAFPQRQFILIGDSGEQDPEIYGQIARQHPGQIVGIFIRNVTGEKRGDERFSAAFQDTPDDHWALFDEVPEITQQIINLARTKH